MDHRRKLLEECGLPTDGMTLTEMSERAEAAQRLRDPRSVPANRLMPRWTESEGKD